jgi:hypothetical protein
VLLPNLDRIRLIPIESTRARELLHSFLSFCILPLYTVTGPWKGSIQRSLTASS